MAETNYPNGINIGTASGGSASFQLGGTAVTASAAELNVLDGAVSAKVITGPSAVAFAAGTALITTTGGVTTGLGGTVSQVVASFAQNAGGTTLGYVSGTASLAGAGSVTFAVFDTAGVAGTAAAAIHWIAVGTA